MTQEELLRHLVEVLEALGLEYMIGGSQASMYYGEPRLTRDVDVVVALRAEHLGEFLARFPAGEFYVDADAAGDESRQFNIVDRGSGFKIDVYVNPDTAYDHARLARRQRLPLAGGIDAYFARPEDIILYKLVYARQGFSGMHLRDVLGILRVSGEELDEQYIRTWADRLAVRESWDDIRRQV